MLKLLSFMFASLLLQQHHSAALASIENGPSTMKTLISLIEEQRAASNGLQIENSTTEAPLTTTTTFATTSVMATTMSLQSNGTSTFEQPATASASSTTTITTTAMPILTNHNASLGSNMANNSITTATTITEHPLDSSPFEPYCHPKLCELFNGTHVYSVPHIACQNHGDFAATCGSQPRLLYMSERRRNLILDLHNLARSRIASGQVPGYKMASHMPQLKWDMELEHLATLHVKRCKFAHDLCRNTERFEFSGQNIGYFWIGRSIKSHTRRMKNFIVSWFKEYLDANQTFIDAYHPHPEGKKIGHFTLLVSDRVHRVGCAAIRYREPSQLQDTKFLMTCNYDYTNILGEPIYQSGPTATKCSYTLSEKFPALCDWKTAVYEYEHENEDTENEENLTNSFDNNLRI